jgi:hypothetical protein
MRLSTLTDMASAQILWAGVGLRSLALDKSITSNPSNRNLHRVCTGFLRFFG